MFIHISDIKKFLHCEHIYFYSKDEVSDFHPYLRSDESINDLLIKYLNIDKCYIGEKNDNLDKFRNSINEYEWFCHPRLVDGDLRINIPFIHKVNDSFDLYFVYYGTVIKELDVLTYRISSQMMRKLGYEVNNIYLIYFNGDYINDGELDPSKLFLTTSEYKDIQIKYIVDDNEIDYENLINKIKGFDIENSKPKKCKYCRQNGICKYYNRCFPNEEEIDDDSILTLVSSSKKNGMYESGIKYLKDADIEIVEGNRVQYAQIVASRNGGLFVDKTALREWLKNIENRQISFIDFEWDRYCVPPYINMKPLDVLCFEYALYYLDSNGEMKHKTFVGTGDCRKDFIEGLINDLPSEGPILAYNADGAEKLRLIELADMFPEYKDKLLSIKDRFIDLAIPFIEGLVYDIRMRGNYTLKCLVDMVSDYSYKNLEIDDGMEAVYNWRNADKGSEDYEKIVDNLKKYCSLDAYGLYLVYNWLTKLISE